jgi:hypothetical protein
MPSFTRSRRQEVIAYGQSVTKLRASDLIEEGTQCPICYAEIASFACIYLHRGCANIVCSSCFESNLSQEVDFDICLICKGHLADYCTENAIPNWHFTYTDIPLPASFGHSSSSNLGPPGTYANNRVLAGNTMAWSQLLSPQHKFHSSENGQPGARARPAYNVEEGFRDLSAIVGRLKADIAEQRKKMRDLRVEEFANRDNNNRSPRQDNTNPRHHDNNKSESQNAYPGYQNNNNFRHQTNPSSWLEIDADSRPWYNRSPRNPQNVNSSNPWPLLNPTAQNQRNINPGLGNGTNPRDQKPINPRHQKKPKPKQQQGKPRGFYGEGLHPALARYYDNSQAQPQQQRPNQHARNRGLRGKQRYHQGQNNVYVPHA